MKESAPSKPAAFHPGDVPPEQGNLTQCPGQLALE